MGVLMRLALFLLFAPFLTGHAFASSEGGCSPTMRVFYNYFSSCNSIGLLSPGNDTRVNLTYLVADAHHQKLPIQPSRDKANAIQSDSSQLDWQRFAEALAPEPQAAPDGSTQVTTGEGSICVSDAGGSAQFVAAVAAAADLSEQEKQVLIEARKALQCSPGSSSTEQPQLPQVQSASAKEFLAYLSASYHFYWASHTDASTFITLTNSTQPWVKEASRYMQARVQLLAAQANAFDDYGTMQKNQIDQTVVGIALDSLNGYLKDYPNGAYAASATGLLRRAFWLGGDATKQLEAYAKLASANEVNEASLAVINEMDFKLPIESYAESTSTPLLLAVQDLRLMREQLDNDGKPTPGMKSDVLEAQRARFASEPELFNYLRALRAWFVDKDAKAVLGFLSEKPIPAELTYLEFSRQLLRAAALDATNDAAARSVYLAMFPSAQSAYQREALELSLALFDERHKNVGAVFMKDSPIKDPAIRKQLLDYVAGPIILRQQATATDVPQDERDTALFRLLSRDLVQGHFKGFLDDIKLLPPKPAAVTATDASQQQPADRFEVFRWDGRKEGYICPDLIDVAKILNANARDIRGRMCLGDFFRLMDVGDISVSDKDRLGGTGTLFAGKPLFRSELYADIMKDKSASRDDRAYALFRAVHCYATTGNNGCGGTDVPRATRKGWYDELKGNYGDTAWAKDLRYYW